MAQAAIFVIFDQVQKDLDCELFYSGNPKRHNVHIIFTI